VEDVTGQHVVNRAQGKAYHSSKFVWYLALVIAARSAVCIRQMKWRSIICIVVSTDNSIHFCCCLWKSHLDASIVRVQLHVVECTQATRAETAATFGCSALKNDVALSFKAPNSSKRDLILSNNKTWNCLSCRTN
jgi:hypothetical protein